MFERHFGFSFNPFDKTLPASMAFATHDFTEISNRLDYLVTIGGIGLICAAPGFGKTYAIRAWAEHTNKNLCQVHYLCLSTVSVSDFYASLCTALGLEPAYRKTDMFKSIQEHLSYMSREQGVQCVIIIDEAQYLCTNILRDLKMLTNFEMDSKNCATFVLVGTPVLTQILSRSVHEAIRQRIVVSYSCAGITKEEVNGYIDSLITQTHASPTIIDSAAKDALAEISRGSIRRLNRVLVAALTIAAQHSALSVDAEMVYAASEQLNL